MEPYKIKAVEPLFLTTKAQRRRILQKAHLNLFLVPAKYVTIDLLTDSGTGALSHKQLGALLMGDESYAGGEDFFTFEQAVQKLTGMQHVIPVHQGRSGERILLESLKDQGTYIVSNTLFDTTRANANYYGLKVIDLICKEAKNTTTHAPFKGNINLELMEKTLKTKLVAGVMLTITNNSGGGQPVSMHNIKQCKAICQKYSVSFILDACRFAENAWFIKQKEKGFSDKSLHTITREVFDQADMCFVSAKKDGLSHIGGFIGIRKKEDRSVLTQKNISDECKNRLILSDGFPTYGGMAGRELSVIALGLEEVLEEPYLTHRMESTKFLHTALAKAGIPVICPAGGHAVYIDAKKLLPHIPVSAYPGQALVSALYEFAGIRSFEIGSVMMGQTKKDGSCTYHSHEWVRLAIPRRVYTTSHLEYVAQSIITFAKKEAQNLKGIKIVRQAPVLRHFTAHFAWKKN